MEYNTGHTARFLVSFFLVSKHSLKYPLTAIDCNVLRYIADSIDINFHFYGKKHTRLNLKQISLYARCSRDSAKHSVNKLIRQRLIGAYKPNGSKPKYWIGKVPIAYKQRNDKLSTSEVMLNEKRGNGYPASDRFSELQTNNKAKPKDIVQDQKKNSEENDITSITKTMMDNKKINNQKLVTGYEHGKSALREMAEKHGLTSKH